MNNLVEKIKNQISSLKEEVLNTTNQIALFRKEGDIDNVGVSEELQGKLEILHKKIGALQSNLVNYKKAVECSTICPGKTIELSDPNVGSKKLTLVLPEDANPAENMISSNSPFGKALLNRSKGEEITIQTPGGNKNFSIVDFD